MLSKDTIADCAAVTCEGSGEVCDEEEVGLIVVISQSYSLLLLDRLLPLDGCRDLGARNVRVGLNAVGFS